MKNLINSRVILNYNIEINKLLLPKYIISQTYYTYSYNSQEIITIIENNII